MLDSAAKVVYIGSESNYRIHSLPTTVKIPNPHLAEVTLGEKMSSHIVPYKHPIGLIETVFDYDEYYEYSLLNTVLF